MKRDDLFRRMDSADESLRRQAESVDLVTLGDAYTEAGDLAATTGNLFADLGFEPDGWKAYMQAAFCRSFPNVAGPASVTGNYLGFTPRVLEKNHHKLLHQQINLDHKMKFHDPEGIRTDRIIGCVVATSFPKPPVGQRQWNEIPADVASAPEITFLSTIFKAAEGVNRFLGDHLSGKRQRSVSVEVNASLENLGIYIPSSREIFSLMDAPDELYDAVEPGDKGLLLGKAASGEQLAWAYGINDSEIDLRGGGVVDYPADQTARIQYINASRETAELCAVKPDCIPPMLVGRRCLLAKAMSGAECRIAKVHTEGRHGMAGWLKQASNCDPVLELCASDGSRAFWHLTDVELLG